MGVKEFPSTDIEEAMRGLGEELTPSVRALLEAQRLEIGRLRVAFRVNMLRLGFSDEEINRVLDAQEGAS